MDNDQNIQLSEFKKDFKELFYDNNLNLLANRIKYSQFLL